MIFKRIAELSILAQIAAATWLLSGMVDWCLFVMMWIAVIGFAAVLLNYVYSKDNERFLFSQPFFLSGVFILILTLIQALNPALRVLQMESFTRVSKIDYIKFLPSGVDAPFESINTWWGLIFILIIVLSASTSYIVFKNSKFTRRALLFFALNCVAMSLFAIAQKYFNAPAIYWEFNTEADYYGTFFLSNAAAIYLDFGVAVSVVLFFLKPLNFEGSFRCFLRRTFYFILALICAAGSFYSGSTGGLFVLIAIILIFILVVIYTALVKKASQFVAIGVSFCTFVAILITSLILFFTCQKQGMFASKYVSLIESSLNSRSDIRMVATDVAGQNFFYGVGANGFRYYAAPAAMSMQNHGFAGAPKAFERPHCEVLQYFVEYGIVGFSAIFFAFCAYIKRLADRRRLLQTGNLVLLLSLTVVFAYSFFEVYFHITSTAVVFAVLCMACLTSFNPVIKSAKRKKRV